MSPLFTLLLLIAVVVLVVVVLRQRAAASRPVEPTGGAVVARQDPFADTESAAGDPRTLKVGDMVEYLDRRFFVRGSLRLREGGFTWSEHFLDDVEGTKRWVSVEEDPDLEVVLWTEIDETGLSPDAAVLTVDGVEYRRDEHGTASYEAEGSTGVGNTGRVEYVDYEGPGGKYLAFERFAGGAWEAGLGERVPAGTLTIYPGPDRVDIRVAAPYVDTRAADLAWALDLEPLPALAIRRVRVPGGSVELRLLGSSHQAVLRRGTSSLSEAVACLPGIEASLPGRAAHDLPDGEYVFRSRVVQLPSGPFRSAVRLIALVTALSGRGLVGRFPGTPGALTALAAWGTRRGAGWWTCHTYPQTGEIVLTRSSVMWT